MPVTKITRLSVRQITDTALELTTRNLEYKYGSADPANGGMDCSGFVFYVLTQNGVRDVPRDSSQQYVWLRKAGNFKAVNSRQEDTFELDELVPGDLLFWTGTYSIERDPPITHAMIYLGRKKGTNQRIMVGASDGRTYEGESRYGVSVFDFKIPKPAKTNEGQDESVLHRIRAYSWPVATSWWRFPQQGAAVGNRRFMGRRFQTAAPWICSVTARQASAN